MFKLTTLITIAILLTSPSLFATHAPETAPIYAIAKYPKHANPLLKIVREKSTVGVIPYYVYKGKVYIFLGQELTGGKKEASGTFSDFGGSASPDGTTVLQHALRELTEETMGQLKLSEADVLKNGYLLYKKNTKNREIYYIFVKLSEKQYLKTKKFHTAKVRLKASGVPNSYLEKETFLWVRLDDLLPPPVVAPATEAITTEEATPPIPVIPSTIAVDANCDNKRFVVHTPDGATHNILVRGYFLRDCLQNPDLPGLLKSISK